ncbi:MAG: hypothetical protein R3E31_08520 [Chloroflexota bacterium]
MILTLSPLEKFLVDLITLPRAKQCIAVNVSDLKADNSFWNKAVANKVASVVAESLASILSPKEIPASWLEVHQLTAHRITQQLWELDRVFDMLSISRVKSIVLENGALARGVFSNQRYIPLVISIFSSTR